MFDLFGRKRIKDQDLYIGMLVTEIADLKTALREQDQLVYNMSQCANWTQMRGYFGPLVSATETRRRAESDRIADNILKELNAP